MTLDVEGMTGNQPTVPRVDVELQHERALALDLLDADGVRIVDELAGQLGEQLSQCSWPSAGAGRSPKAARPWRANP